MKSSSPPSSSSPTSATETPPLASSSPPRPLRGLQSPELQAEFLRERQNKLRSRGDVDHSSVVSPPPSSSPLTSPSSTAPSSPLTSPFSTAPSSPSSTAPSSPRSSSPLSPPGSNTRQARLSLSSPELLTELKDSRTRPLRHVTAPQGLTTVFSGRGRGGGRGQVSGSAHSTRPANPKKS